VSDDADMLVVGSHGRSGLSRLMLGSVAMACVNHASCPVVVVRSPSED
jgi:nucleotide-binding universal stress UspA family protein